jgi:hypothetical protein
LIDPETRREVPAWLQSNTELARRYRLEQAVERIYMPRQATAEVPAGALTELYDHAAAALGDVPPRGKKALHVSERCSEVSSNAIHRRSCVRNTK